MKSQNKSKSKHKASAASPAGADSSRASDASGNKLKLVLRLSSDQGEKKWIVGGKNEEEQPEVEEEEKEEEVVPEAPTKLKIRFNKALLETAAQEEEPKRRKSPRRDTSPAPNGDHKRDTKRKAAPEETEDVEMPKRVSTRIRKSTTDNDEFLFGEDEVSPPSTRSKRKRTSTGAGPQVPSLPLAELTKRPPKRARQSLSAEESSEQAATDETGDGTDTKKKLSPRVKKVPKSPVDPDAPKKLLPLKKVLAIMLTKMIRKDTYGFFYNPVTEEEAPDYFSYITTPMDFSTMRTKLGSTKYTTLKLFEDDFRQICKNAMTYNGPTTVYYQEAKALLEFGEELVQQYAPKIDLNRKPSVKSKGPKSPATPGGAADQPVSPRPTRSRAGAQGESKKDDATAKEKGEKTEKPERKRKGTARQKEPKQETTEQSTEQTTTIAGGNAFSQPLAIPDAQTPERPKRKYTKREGGTPRKRGAAAATSSFALTGAANPLAMSYSPVSSSVPLPYGSGNVYMPPVTTHSVTYGNFKQQQQPQPPTQPAATPTSLSGFVNSIPLAAVPQVKSFIGNLTSSSPVPMSLPPTKPVPIAQPPQPPQPQQPQQPQQPKLNISSQILDDIKTVEVASSFDKSALEALESLTKEGFDVSFLRSLLPAEPAPAAESTTATEPSPTTTSTPAEQKSQPPTTPAATSETQASKSSKLDDNIQTHLAGLSIPPSDDSIQAMLNKNAELLLNLQLSQYERSTPTLTDKESRMATQLCESLTALSSKVTPRDVSSPAAVSQAMASRVQRLGVPPTPVQTPPVVTIASPQRPLAPPQSLPATPLPVTTTSITTTTTPTPASAEAQAAGGASGLAGSNSIFTMHSFSPAPVPLTFQS